MNTKKAAVLLFVLWTATVTFGYTMIGPPTAELRVNPEICHEANVGYIYSFSKMDIGVDGGDIDDVELTRHYFTWGIALDENFDFNLLLGATSAEVDNSDIGTGATGDFDGDNGFSWGFNLKNTFCDGETVDWGAALQMTWFSTEDTVDGVDVDVDEAYDLQVAVGPTIDWERWKLYGGVFYYMLDADLDLSAPSFGYTGTPDIEEDDQFGAFIGAQFEIMEMTDLTIEYMQGNDSNAVAAAIGWRF